MARLHHLALGARDVEAVAAFYREVLGLAEDRRHHYDDGRLRSVWLRLDEGVLMVEHTEAEVRRVEGVGAGPFLIAVAGTEAERETFEGALVGRGGEVEERTAYTSYGRDPEGNRVAVSTLRFATA